MRAKDFILESAELRVDNPGGKWLQYKQEDAAAAGTNRFGSPARFGSVTAWFTEPVMIPVDIAARVKGINAEQKNVRKDNLDWLIDYMKTNSHLPKTDRDTEYVPFIQVDYTGTPWVNEGNHRIMAAKALGWKYIPIELRYFNGGEEVKGVFHPDRVKAWDSQGRKK